MEIIIHLDIKKISDNYEAAINEYFKRLTSFCKIKYVSYKNIKKIEYKKNSYKFIVVPLKETISSVELANIITKKSLEGFSILEFVIIDFKKTNTNEIKEQLKDNIFDGFEELAITSFIFTCDLWAVILSEQIYRAYTINNNITYHK